MESGRIRPRRSRRAAGIPIRLAFGVVIAAAACAFVSAAGGIATRALWVPTSSLVSRASIQRAVASAVAGGFDAVLAPLSSAPRDRVDVFDGVAELLREARASGLSAFVSVAVTVAADVGELPASRDHVIYQHPEWLMVPRALAAEMLKVEPRSPAYLGQIARWTRANAERVDGIYISPLDPVAASYLVSTLTAAVQKYAADGVYLSALEFPGRDFDYSRHTMETFRAGVRAGLSPVERARLDAVESIDPFAYTEEFPDEWSRFRESALTNLLESLRASLFSTRQGFAVAAAVRADPDVSLQHHFQDWRSWLDRGLVDRVGNRAGLGTSILMSADGVFPADPPIRLSSTQADAGSLR